MYTAQEMDGKAETGTPEFTNCASLPQDFVFQGGAGTIYDNLPFYEESDGERTLVNNQPNEFIWGDTTETENIDIQPHNIKPVYELFLRLDLGDSLSFPNMYLVHP